MTTVFHIGTNSPGQSCLPRRTADDFNGNLTVALDAGYSCRFYARGPQGNIRVVTDASGNILRTNHYDPYCQEVIAWPTTSSTAPLSTAGANLVSKYMYGGKEWDTTLSLYDFSARYYNPSANAFFSTMDPLCEKYYSISPYVYCAGNPVNLVDPNGEKIIVRDFSEGVIIDYQWNIVDGVWGFYDSNSNLYNGENQYILSVAESLMTLMEGENGAAMIKEIVEDDLFVVSIATREGLDNFYSVSEKEISWNPKNHNLGYPSISLGHELAHALDDLRGTYNSGVWAIKKLDNGKTEEARYAELFATHYENLIRKEHGLPLRYYYFIGSADAPQPPYILDKKGRSLYFNTFGTTKYTFIVNPNRRYQY